MWLLARILPLAIGSVVPENDPYWLNYLRLLEIMDFLFAGTIHREDCGYLHCLISDHHTAFLHLYPHVSITPKMHAMIHMPRLMLEWVFIPMAQICYKINVLLCTDLYIFHLVHFSLFHIGMVHWSHIGPCDLKLSIGITSVWHRPLGTSLIYVIHWHYDINCISAICSWMHSLCQVMK